jgi:hypothetical protein
LIAGHSSELLHRWAKPSGTNIIIIITITTITIARGSQTIRVHHQLITLLGSITGSKPGTRGILKSVAPGQYHTPWETST